MMTDVMVEVKKRVKEEIEDLLDCDHWTSVHAATKPWRLQSNFRGGKPPLFFYISRSWQ